MIIQSVADSFDRKICRKVTTLGIGVSLKREILDPPLSIHEFINVLKHCALMTSIGYAERYEISSLCAAIFCEISQYCF